MAQCLLAIDAWTVLDRRGPWPLVSRILRRHWRRSALATHEQFVLLLLIGFHLVHTSQAALHALDIVIDIRWALNRLIVVVIAATAPTSVPSLQASHPCRGLVNLVECIRRPRVRGCLLFWRSHALQRGHDVVHGVSERRRRKLLGSRRRRLGSSEAVLGRGCR